MITTITVVTVLIAIYFYLTRTFNYWKTRGIKHDTPLPLFGTNMWGYFLQRSVAQIANDMYWKYPEEKVVGFYRSAVPELIIRDPEIIKRILMTDFYNYHPRGLNRHKTVEPLLRNLFFADGDLWRLLRQRMTPAFTSGKLKAMFPLIVERAEKLQARALSAAAAGRPLDARDLMARYTTDFIGACGFGLDADSLNEEDSEFRKLGVKIFHPRPRDIAAAILKEIFPRIFHQTKLLGHLENDMKTLINAVLEQRNHQPSERKDFVDLLLEARQKGEIVADSIENIKADGTPEKASLELTDELIAAQMFVFFAAGFETSSSATSFTLHQLAFNQEVQRKAQENIDQVLARYDNKLCYDAVKEMYYLEWCFKEGMRIFPSLGFLIRQCARKCTIPELNITIDEGVGIIIPVEAMQNDPQYFDNPSEFRPERFDPENFDSEKNKFVYLPFGDGPRNCIGARLGLMQSLAGLAAVLSRFSVEPARDTPRQLTVDPRSGIVQTVVGGVPLLFKERKF